MTTPEASFGDLVSVIAFYGIEHSAANAESFFDLSLRWFDAIGHKPNTGYVTKGNKPRALPISKLANWRTNAKWDEITACGFDAVEPSGKTQGYPFLTTDDSSVLNGPHAEFVANETLMSLDQLAMSQTIEEAVRLLKPAYGIGFVWEKRRGPSFYVVGINCGPAGHVAVGEEYEQNLRVCRWGDIGLKEQVYRLGYLRNVYPYNFLSQPQLDRAIDGIQLREWIAQDAGRGKLVSISENMFVWTVEPNRIQDVQQSLERAGIIFDYKKWVKKPVRP